MTWDLFCRVIDNLGDIGVCWRLAADLAGRGLHVRLWTDDASALAWMAPHGAAGVEVHPWPQADSRPLLGDVVIEAFGCKLPIQVARAMAARQRPPVWINLEHLSAEDYVERSHRLPSPQPAGLRKWFFFPGFTPATGGLIREPDLMDQRNAFDAAAWLTAQAIARRDGERVVSLFCYDGANVESLLERLCPVPTLLLVTPGAAAREVLAALGPSLQRQALRTAMLPWLSQTDFDRLLWASDLSFVRGEDSFVRAQWAGRPFVWQPYPQADGVHHVKREAFLAHHLRTAPADLAAPVIAAWAAWGDRLACFPMLPQATAWQQHALSWRAHLLRQADLTTQLIDFVREKG
jgi:uncharacterized repeat protein (TIGR03837 family)